MSREGCRRAPNQGEVKAGREEAGETAREGPSNFPSPIGEPGPMRASSWRQLDGVSRQAQPPQPLHHALVHSHGSKASKTLGPPCIPRTNQHSTTIHHPLFHAVAPVPALAREEPAVFREAHRQVPQDRGEVVDHLHARLQALQIRAKDRLRLALGICGVAGPPGPLETSGCAP